MSRATRRDLLGAGAFTALTGIAAAAIARPDNLSGMAATITPDDAELIAIGREAAVLLDQRKPLAAQFWALPAGPAKGDELEAIANAMEPIDERMDVLIGRAVTLKASGREAMAAKARLIGYDIWCCHSQSGVLDPEDLGHYDRLTWSLVEDLVGAGVA